MNIGIIGAGEMGTCLASKLVKLGHTVSVANSRGPASLQQLTEHSGAAAATVEDAVKNKKVIIVSIPQKNIPGLPKRLFTNLPKEAVVIDTGNYYPCLRDGAIPALELSGIDSLWVQVQLGIRVVKAFNSILATSLENFGKPKGDQNRIAVAVSGDDGTAKDLVCQLVDELGFDPFDMGTIAQSWKQQPGSPVYCRDITLNELKKRVDGMEIMGPGMHEVIIAKRKIDEVLMKADYAAYLESLREEKQHFARLLF